MVDGTHDVDVPMRARGLQEHVESLVRQNTPHGDYPIRHGGFGRYVATCVHAAINDVLFFANLGQGSCRKLRNRQMCINPTA